MRPPPILAIVALGALAVALPAACGGGSQTSGFNTNPDGGSSSGASSGGDGSVGSFGDGAGGSGGHSDAPTTTCTNLQCQVHACGKGKSTKITGKVTDPAGNNPLYNVVAYIPNSKGGVLDNIPIGINSASCSCGALFSGEPIADGLTTPDGTFEIDDAPDGKDIPLVVQIGKWRKEITIPSVAMCGSTDAGSIALPKNLTDGKYASIPNIAVSTGGADTLECLLTRVGVDESVFSGDPTDPSARVHVFQGSGGNAASGSPSSPTSLWDSVDDLKRYDIMMLSCEGHETDGVSGATATAVADYVNEGGRVFGEHYHYAFFTQYASNPGTAYPEFANVADWIDVAGSGGSYGGAVDTVIETKLSNGKSFPEGLALSQWLGNVGALTGGDLVIAAGNARENGIVNTGNLATAWAQTAPGVTPASTQYFSWDMPFDAKKNDAGVPEYCGRVVYSDLHVSGSGNEDYGARGNVVPTGCDNTAKLSQDEDALEFILFDLSSCVTPVGTTPIPPGADGGGSGAQ